MNVLLGSKTMTNVSQTMALAQYFLISIHFIDNLSEIQKRNKFWGDLTQPQMYWRKYENATFWIIYPYITNITPVINY